MVGSLQDTLTTLLHIKIFLPFLQNGRLYYSQFNPSTWHAPPSRASSPSPDASWPPPPPRMSSPFAVRSLPMCFTCIQCCWDGDPRNMKSTLGNWKLTQSAQMCPGNGFKYWLVIMNNPGGVKASKEQMIDCYMKTLAKVVGSEEEAKKKIYKLVNGNLKVILSRVRLA